MLVPLDSREMSRDILQQIPMEYTFFFDCKVGASPRTTGSALGGYCNAWVGYRLAFGASSSLLFSTRLALDRSFFGDEAEENR